MSVIMYKDGEGNVCVQAEITCNHFRFLNLNLITFQLYNHILTFCENIS